MLTAPYHFGIVACPTARKSQPPLDGDPDDSQSGILYRGSIPAARNLPFLRRLGLKTIVVCKKKPLGETEVLIRWAAKHGVEVKWVKADIMTEESLGMGRSEVSELLKYILDTSQYPLYIADVDGISHTTLIVACLRKLQGWHMDSIMGEVERFEPDHEDYAFSSFIGQYLTTGSSADPYNLPAGPYPSWLWPQAPSSSNNIQLSRSNTRDRDRERSSSSASTTLLPFPHPMAARKHPTMRLSFPVVPQPMAPPTVPLARVPSRRDKDSMSQGARSERSDKALSRVSTVSPSVELPAFVTSPLEQVQSGLASILLGLSGSDEGSKLNRIVSFSNKEGQKPVRSATGATSSSLTASSPERRPTALTRQISRSSSSEVTDEPAQMDNRAGSLAKEDRTPRADSIDDQEDTDIRDSDRDDDGEEEEEEGDEDGRVDDDNEAENEDEEEDEDDEDEEEEEDEEDDDDGLQATALHISALDLAGYG